MSGPNTNRMSKSIADSEVYELASDVKVEFLNSDYEREIILGGPQEESEQYFWDSSSNRKLEELNRDTHQTQTPFIDGHIGFKCEVNRIKVEDKSSSDGEDDLDAGSFEINSNALTLGSINLVKTELNQLYLDLFQCERDCVTCQKYIRELSEHIRSTHAVRQPIRDPLHVDPLDMNQSSPIEIKCEVEEDIVHRIHCSVSDSSFESKIENDCDGDSGSNTEYNASVDLTRKRKSGRELVKDNKRDKSSWTVGIVCQTKIHNGDKHFKCEECGKNFIRKDNLTIPVRNLTDDGPFKCEQCGKGFKAKRHLFVHLRSHTGERPYNCGECGKGFATSSQLWAHRKGHNKEKTFKCDVCNKALKTSATSYGHR